MAIRVDERYVVHAPVGPVWDYLIDPRRVVGCVPGGEVAAVLDERTFDGTIRVAVGPLTLAYAGRVELAEVDSAAHRVKIVGTAHERAGPGSARLTLDSWLTPLPGGETEVVAHARVDVTGAIVELGRGVLESLGHVVFQDFASCVRATIEAEEAVRHGARAPAAPARRRRAPVRAFPLVFRAVKRWMAGWFRPRAGGRDPRRDAE